MRLAILVASLVTSLAAPVLAQGGASALEDRLIAPCCWTQTLDVHDSPLAVELRAEIERRLEAGEAPSAIEDDLVGRYGERIRAVPAGADVRDLIPVACLVGLVLGALAVRRRVGQRRLTPATSASAAPPRDELDDRIDAALRALDDA